MIDLGFLYAHGNGVEQNYLRAQEWFEKAGPSQRLLTVAILFNKDGEESKDYNISRNLFEISAAAGYSEAMLNLGRAYVGGWGVERDLEKAREWIEKALATGDNNAVVELSWIWTPNGDAKSALATVDKYVQRDIRFDNLRARIRRAHALMYLERLPEAREIYLSKMFKSQPEEELQFWRNVIAKDFSDLRRVGREHPLMAEVETKL